MNRILKQLASKLFRTEKNNSDLKKLYRTDNVLYRQIENKLVDDYKFDNRINHNTTTTFRYSNKYRYNNKYT